MSELRIPDGAMPVVEILRRDVERPSAKIVQSGDKVRPRPRFECGKCPMGLHPSAIFQAPVIDAAFQDASPFRQLSEGTRVRFARWWDALSVKRAYQALDLIWPEES